MPSTGATKNTKYSYVISSGLIEEWLRMVSYIGLLTLVPQEGIEVRIIPFTYHSNSTEVAIFWYYSRLEPLWIELLCGRLESHNN